MILTTEAPSSWHDLQDKVCKYLNQAGYNAVSPKTIDLVRGKAEVDVFATADDEMLKQFICECKYWDTPVPQEKIHAFRSVVQDSGSMFGIMISKSGFQHGAIEAARCSNVILKDWQGFIDMLAMKWLNNRFRNLIILSGPLSVYADPLDVPPQVFQREESKAHYLELHTKVFSAYMLLRSLEMGMYPKEGPCVIDKMEFTDFNSMFDRMERIFSESVGEFKKLFEACKVEQWKLDFSEKPMFESHICDYLTQ